MWRKHVSCLIQVFCGRKNKIFMVTVQFVGIFFNKKCPTVLRCFLCIPTLEAILIGYWTIPELFDQIYGLKMDPNFTTPIQRIQTIAQFHFILISKKFDCLNRVRERRLRKFNMMISSIFRDDRLSGEFCHPLNH